MNQQDLKIIDSLKDTVREMESYIREEYCTDCGDFLENDILKRAVAMCIISIDQLAGGFSDEFITKHQHIIYARFKTIRYIAGHDYRALDFSVLWSAATKEVPVFLDEILTAAGVEKSPGRLGQPVARSTGIIQDTRSAGAERETRNTGIAQEIQSTKIMQSEPVPERQPQPIARSPEVATSKPEQKSPFTMNELYKRQAYTQMMQTNMSKDEAAKETKKEVNGLLDMLEKEKRSRGL